ncbi:DNA polymerase III subunit chi [Variovorax dokdonensis]|uniref:DNA polymerase III subunit chi n=1 Tax=Variovorax dokdonensis TaxID=344883 RepID=A0ABT7NC92_9BURK|nr:DNA polymerase III subunit chi [Variovorax dokdonensis]
MTDIEFRVDLPDKFDYALRLARKYALQGQAQLVVAADADTIDAIDTALWDRSAAEFLPHCKADAPEEVLRRSPVVLAQSSQGADDALPHGVLLNLGAAVPKGFERFERLIELVGTADGDREDGRERWRHYKSRGYALRHQSAFGERT